MESPRLTPEMVAPALSDSPENRAWLAEWKRVGAPPGSLQYALRTFEEQLRADREREPDVQG